MMMAIGCIQAQRCHTNRCPVGITTQDPKRVRALVVEDKVERVRSFQAETVHSATRLIASMGMSSPAQLSGQDLYIRTAFNEVQCFDDLNPPLQPGQLLADPPDGWVHVWDLASADHF